MTVRESAAPAQNASEGLAGASGRCAAELRTLILAQSELLEPAYQRAARQAKRPGRLSLVALGGGQGTHQPLAFVPVTLMAFLMNAVGAIEMLVADGVAIGEFGVGVHGLDDLARQVGNSDKRALGDNDRAFNDIFELANVAGPGVRFEDAERIVVNLQHGFP